MMFLSNIYIYIEAPNYSARSVKQYLKNILIKKCIFNL